MPWPEWGETDFLLTQAYQQHRDGLCPCGCGHPAEQSLDPATEGRWHVQSDRCFARAAIEEWRENHPDDTGPDRLAGTRLLAVGEEPFDDLAFDPSKAAAEFAELQARLGLT